APHGRAPHPLSLVGRHPRPQAALAQPLLAALARPRHAGGARRPQPGVFLHLGPARPRRRPRSAHRPLQPARRPRPAQAQAAVGAGGLRLLLLLQRPRPRPQPLAQPRLVRLHLRLVLFHLRLVRRLRPGLAAGRAVAPAPGRTRDHHRRRAARQRRDHLRLLHLLGLSVLGAVHGPLVRQPPGRHHHPYPPLPAAPLGHALLAHPHPRLLPPLRLASAAASSAAPPPSPTSPASPSPPSGCSKTSWWMPRSGSAASLPSPAAPSSAAASSAP